MEKLVPVIFLAFIILILASLWKIFTKAGKPGWAAIIPIYNLVVMLDIVGKPVWWIILFFIPFIGAIMGIVLGVLLGQAFNKSTGFIIGMVLLGPIFYPILAFGDSQYGGGAASAAPAAPAPEGDDAPPAE